MRFPPQFLDEIRNRVTLSELVRKQVVLKRQGREWAGLSPFNQEKTPSFFVNDEKQFYHCFSSGKHGDVFTWLTETEGLSFPEAVETLAGLAGLQMPRQDPAEVARYEKRRSLYDVYEAAARYFQRCLELSDGDAARAYLQGRGLDTATIRDFRIGYAPPGGGAFLKAMADQGIETAALLEATLARRPEDGRAPYAFFRDKIIFPVNDRRGRVIAFGARRLDRPGQEKAGPKYINSADHPLFDKGATLYGLDRARQAATGGAPLLVVEGYMDVIALHRAGYSGAVAPLGTALTAQQIETLWHLYPERNGEPVLCFDGDRAGRQAAERAVERALPLLGPARSLRFAFLPEGEDPDSLVAAQGATAMQAVVDQAKSFADMLWQAETARQAPETPERRAGLKRRLMAATDRIRDREVAALYRREFSDRLWRLGRSSQRRTARDARSDQQRRSDRPGAAGQLHRPVGAESEWALLRLILCHPHFFEEVGEEFADIRFSEQRMASLQAEIIALLGVAPSLDASALSSQLRQRGYSHVLDLVAQRADARIYGFCDPGADTATIRSYWDNIQAARRCRMVENELMEARQALCEDPGNSRKFERLENLHKEMAAAQAARSIWDRDM
mgnify:CR=1 FL=1